MEIILPEIPVEIANILLPVLYILGGVILFFVALFIFRAILHWRTRVKNAFQMKILLVTVPKEAALKGEKQETTLQKIQEQIAVAETLWTGIGGLRAQRGIKTWLFGRTDHVSLEIVAQRGLIYFYIAVPQHLCSYLEQQINAQYPDANIEEVPDYNIFTPTGAIAAAYLTFKRPSVFPIKTFRKAESDPLNSLTNILSKIGENEGAAIQLVIRSSRKGWRDYGVKIARRLQQGKSLGEAMGKGMLAGLGKAVGETISPPSKEAAARPKEQYRLSPMEEEMVKGLENKASKAGLDVNIRLMTCAQNQEWANAYLDNIANSFSQFNIYEYGNTLVRKKPRWWKKFVYNFIYRHFDDAQRIVLNTEELASIYHFPLPTTETPNIRWLMAKRLPPPAELPEAGIILGESVYRGEQKLVRIKKADRQRHTYIIGMTGTGKTVFMSNLAIQDIKNGEGVCVIDPHGSTVEEILLNIPKERAEDVIYFDPGNTERPMGLNLLEYDPKYPEQKTFMINEMINIFDKLYDLRQTGGPMFEQYMRNAMLLIMGDPESGSTLMEIPRVLADAEFRRMKLSKCKNPVVYNFWVKEAEKAGGEAALSNMTPYITSKLNQFIANDIMRPIIGQQQSSFNFRELMDKQKILLINLCKGRLGDMNAYLLGLVIVGKILMAALSRADVPEKERKDFYLYIDEFQNFITQSISTILAEARKYKLDLIVAHQYIGQLVKGQDTAIRDAIFGNVGTVITFRIGIDDAETIAKQLAPVVNIYDTMNIEKYHAYIRLLVDNTPMRAFNMHCFPPPVGGDAQRAEMIKQLSSLKYGQERSIVEADIFERLQAGGAVEAGEGEERLA